LDTADRTQLSDELLLWRCWEIMSVTKEKEYFRFFAGETICKGNEKSDIRRNPTKKSVTTRSACSTRVMPKAQSSSGPGIGLRYISGEICSDQWSVID